MKKKIEIIVFALLLCLDAFSQTTSITVDCPKVGKLSSLIDYEDQLTLESLTVTGNINSNDIKFIGTLIQKNLISVDLTNASTSNKKYLENMFGLDSIYTLRKIALPTGMVSGMNCLENIVSDTIICGSTSCNAVVVSRNLAKHYIFREGVDSIGIRGVVFRYVTYSEPSIIESVSLPMTLKFINEETFKNSEQLHFIDLPNSVEEIGMDAFRGTSWYQDTLILPKSIKRFAITAFNSPSKFYYFPDGIEYIDNTRVEGIYVSGKRYEDYITPQTAVVFHLRSSSPPSFNCMSSDALKSSSVYVPKGTSSLYKNTVPWNKATIIEEIYVESISIEKSKSLYVGDRCKMQAQILPTDATDQNIKWESSNSDIAEISDNGILQAKAYGTAMITATSIDGGYTATCEVNVYEHTTGVEMIDKITIPIGETYTLRAQTLPLSTSDGNILYSSDNNSIASVNIEGIVVANKKGTCTITATTEDGGYTATCVVKVTQPVESISLESHSKTMKVGESEKMYVQLTPTSADDKTVYWSSSNEQIASVDENGNLTALKTGETWIKVISNDNPEAMDSCKVTVIQPVTGISLSQSSCTLSNIGESVQLEASVQPEDATNKEITWSSSNESICMVSRGKVIATGYGTAVVLAITVDGGFLASCTVTVQEANAIHDIFEDGQEETPVYDILGNKVQHIIKGHLYIRDGQKFITK